MDSKKIAVLIMLVAICVGTNYAMISLYNVKFMDFIVFVGGFCFGPFIGALTGIVSWIVYGTLNPVGFEVRIWLATMLSEALYGIIGGLINRALLSEGNSVLKEKVLNASIFFGMLGMLLTFGYDVITNAVSGIVWYQSILVGLITGFVPFGLAHVISNAIFFGVGCVPAIRVISELTGGRKNGSNAK
jgi:LytS/YehU family sensor histidine kinase